jgi:membrane associated rhomboid family serine protease
VLPLRDENPTRRTAVVTVALIAVNVAMFVLVQRQQPEVEPVPLDIQVEQGPHIDEVDLDGESAFELEHAAIPCELVHAAPLTKDELLATLVRGDTQACGVDFGVGGSAFPDKRVWVSIVVSMFLHTGWFHLGANMLFLWIFGNNIEDHLGRARYVLFYLLGGFVATVAHVLSQPNSTIPVIGASGAIAAVMGAYLVWFPNARITSLFVVIPLVIKAKWWLMFWFVLQFFTGPNTGVAWVAHVGGFVFGVVMGLLVRLTGRGQDVLWTPDHRGEGWI